MGEVTRGDSADRRAVEVLLALFPVIRRLNVATDSGHITIQWVEPHEQTIDDFSMHELVTLLTSQPLVGLATPQVR